MYKRVIPRDLFNEAKLLKCLGQLSLLIHDGQDKDGCRTPELLSIEYESDVLSVECGHCGGGVTVENRQFVIEQCASTGNLYCRNVRIYIDGRKNFDVYTNSFGLNSREPYPLIYDDFGDNCDHVFNDDGTFTDSFIDFCNMGRAMINK